MSDQRAVADGGSTHTAPAPVRILVVDDEETIRLALGRFLRARGYEVHAVAAGQAALDAITPGAYALKQCDVASTSCRGRASSIPISPSSCSAPSTTHRPRAPR
jgi:PleD family two-component response regulator